VVDRVPESEALYAAWWPHSRAATPSCAGPCRGGAVIERAARWRRCRANHRAVERVPISCGKPTTGSRARRGRVSAESNEPYERQHRATGEHAHAREHPARHRDDRHVRYEIGQVNGCVTDRRVRLRPATRITARPPGRSEIIESTRIEARCMCTASDDDPHVLPLRPLRRGDPLSCSARVLNDVRWRGRRFASVASCAPCSRRWVISRCGRISPSPAPWTSSPRAGIAASTRRSKLLDLCRSRGLTGEQA